MIPARPRPLPPQLHHRLRHVGRVIKNWASRRCINERSEGTLSTYTIMLQLIYLFQTHHLVPKFADIKQGSDLKREDGQEVLQFKPVSEIRTQIANGRREKTPLKGVSSAPVLVDEERPPCCPSSEQEGDHVDADELSLGRLFVDFFLIFGHEAFSGRNGVGKSILDSQIADNDQGILIMRCPISLANVNPMTTETWKLIHAEFARARSLLLERAPFEKIMERARESPLKIRARENRRLRESRAAERAKQSAATTVGTCDLVAEEASCDLVEQQDVEDVLDGGEDIEKAADELARAGQENAVSDERRDEQTEQLFVVDPSDMTGRS